MGRGWRARSAVLGFLLLLSAHPAGQEAAASPATAQHGSIPIRVRRAGEERGAAGVEVRVMDARVQRWFPERMPTEAFELMRRLLPSYVSDAEGIAWVPEPSGFFGVFARAEGWFGASSTALRAGPIEIELMPDPLLRVRVLDRGGKPVAGMSVALLGANAREAGMLLELAETSADGIAGLHPGRFRGNDRVERMFVAVVHGDPQAQLRDVDLARLPAEPLELVLRPTGVLEVVLVDADGKLVEAVGRAHLDVPTRARGPLDGIPWIFSGASYEHGRARFAHAPVGVDLLLRGATSGVLVAEEGGKRVRLDTEGERREVVFTVSHSFLAVGVRLLRGPDEPLVEMPVVVRWPDGRDQKACTDLGGRLSTWALPGFESTGEVRVEFVTLDPNRERRSATLVFTPRGPHYHELGDLGLAPEPLLASGVVDDGRGKPFVRAEVQAYELDESGRLSPAHRSRRDLFAITDVDGRFALYGTAQRKLFLEASHDHALAGDKLEVAPGDTDVRLELARTGVIEARARFPEGAEASVHFLAIDASGKASGQHSMLQGTHSIERLPPGEYTLRCTFGDTTLVEIPGVVVRAGETTRDPRCTPLDLTGKVHRIEVEVHAAPDTPPGRYSVVVREHGGTRSLDAVGSAALGERVALRSPWPVVDLELRAAGLRTIVLEHVSAASEQP
ncbi:MAG: carboxypeptidase regulatory-like domain-containing protein, partial [Planctomycetes bacterium]|nr:carboxypeptidase regulatory-like domain-containing protein [Planctomycetota bacterium]